MTIKMTGGRRGPSRALSRFLDELTNSEKRNSGLMEAIVDIVTPPKFSEEPTCFKCHKKASEIDEYVEAAGEEDMSPAQYVIHNEGTYNRETNSCCCTDCYIKIGMPSSDVGWKAP